VLPARERQPEVIEPVIEVFTGDHDAEIAHVGEVGQAELSWNRLLAEDDVSLRAVQRPPGPDHLDCRAARATRTRRTAGHRRRAPCRAPPRETRPIVLAAAELSQRLPAVTLKVQRHGVEEGDRYLDEQPLPRAIEILVGGIRGGATVGNLFAEPGHRPIGVIKRVIS